MQIGKICSFSTQNYNFPNRCAANSINSKNQIDSFEKVNSINFKAKKSDVIRYSVDWGYINFSFPEKDFNAYFPKQKTLNILNGNKAHLSDVAESLCMYRDEDIKNFATIYYPLRLAENYKKSEEAYKKIMTYVEQAREKVLFLLNTKEELEAKKETESLTYKEAEALKQARREIERIKEKCEYAQSEYLYSVHYEVDDGSEIDTYY